MAMGKKIRPCGSIWILPKMRTGQICISRLLLSIFGPFSTYQKILDKIQICMDKIKNESWNPGKTEKDDLKFINDKLLSNSYQAGFANIQKRVRNPEVYQQLKKNKLSDKLSAEELNKRLEELQEFLKQPECKETFAMKSIIYTYINRFWSGKSFLFTNKCEEKYARGV